MKRFGSAAWNGGLHEGKHRGGARQRPQETDRALADIGGRLCADRHRSARSADKVLSP